MAPREPQRVWICCRLCAEAHLLRTSVDAWLPKEEEHQQAVVEFLEAHAHHPVTQLVPTSPGRSVYSGPLWDPRTVFLIEVTDGREVYVLEALRSDVGAPRRYRLRTGRLPQPCTLIAMDTALALRALQAEFGSAVPVATAQRLVECAADVLTRISPVTIDPAFDDANDPDLAFADWPDAAIEALVVVGRKMLSPSLHQRWQTFLREQCRATGAWAIQVRQLRKELSTLEGLHAPL
jgi:hypothetical protein